MEFNIDIEMFKMVSHGKNFILRSRDVYNVVINIAPRIPLHLVQFNYYGIITRRINFN